LIRECHKRGGFSHLPENKGEEIHKASRGETVLTLVGTAQGELSIFNPEGKEGLGDVKDLKKVDDQKGLWKDLNDLYRKKSEKGKRQSGKKSSPMQLSKEFKNISKYECLSKST